jgi:hypothetical protein
MAGAEIRVDRNILVSLVRIRTKNFLSSLAITAGSARRKSDAPTVKSVACNLVVLP